MAQEAVNVILQAFQNAMQGRMQRDEFLQNLAEKQKAEETRKDEWKQQFEAQQKAAQAIHDLQQKQFEANLAAQQAQQAHQEFKDVQESQTTGVLPSGVKTIPGGQGQVPAQQPATQIQVPQINQSTPVWGSSQVGVGEAYPGLSDQGQQKPLTLSDLQNTVAQGQHGIYTVPPLNQRPDVKLAAQQAAEAEQRKNRETQFKEQADLARAQELHRQSFQDQLEIMGRQQTFQDEQRRKAETAQKSIIDARLANNMQVAKLKATGGLTGFGGSVVTDEDGNATFVPNDPTQIINNTLDQAQNGTLTIDQAKKLFPQARSLGMITGAAQERGIKIITDKQAEKLRELEQVSSLTEDLFQAHKLRLEHPLALQFPLSDASNQLKTLEEKLKGNLAGVSKWLNNVPRFTNVELSKVQDAVLPSTDIFGHTGSEEFKKYEKFVKDIQDSFNTTLSDVPENQRNIIRQRMGLNNYPYLGNTIKSPGTPVDKIGGSVQPSQQQGGQPVQKIIVRKKSTGEKGSISPQYFDPKLYEKVNQ